MKVSNVTHPPRPRFIQPKGMTLDISPQEYVLMVGALRRMAGKAALFPRTMARRVEARLMLEALEAA